MRYSNSLLLRLLKKDIFMKSELYDIVTSNYTLDKLLDALSKDGYIEVSISTFGRKTFYVSITPKGRSVAEQLKNAELAGTGHLKKSFFSRQQQVLMFLGNVGKATPSELNSEIPGSYDDLEELRKLKLVIEVIEEVGGKAMKFFTLTEKGEKVVKLLKENEEIVKG